jgi:hypothetical protein
VDLYARLHGEPMPSTRPAAVTAPTPTTGGESSTP